MCYAYIAIETFCSQLGCLWFICDVLLTVYSQKYCCNAPAKVNPGTPGI